MEGIESIDNDAISALVYKEAQKAGISTKNARKAIKKLKSGSLMSQIAPGLGDSFLSMNPNQTLKEKLRAKIKQAQNSRVSATAKSSSFEQMKQKVYDDREKEAKEKEESVLRQKVQQKNHKKKLKELEKSIGSVTQSLYIECMVRLKEDKYVDIGDKNRDKNIIDLYCQQQQFSTQIDIDELDNI